MNLLATFLNSVPVAVAGFGFLVCGAAALVFKKGYRRGPVGIALLGPVLVVIFGLLAFLFQETEASRLLFYMFALLMLLESWVVIPMITLAGLFDSPYPRSTRLWHAALVMSAWICGPILVPLVLLDGFH